jgi:hypothetical protein
LRRTNLDPLRGEEGRGGERRVLRKPRERVNRKEDSDDESSRGRVAMT